MGVSRAGWMLVSPNFDKGKSINKTPPLANYSNQCFVVSAFFLNSFPVQPNRQKSRPNSMPTNSKDQSPPQVTWDVSVSPWCQSMKPLMSIYLMQTTKRPCWIMTKCRRCTTSWFRAGVSFNHSCTFPSVQLNLYLLVSHSTTTRQNGFFYQKN